MTSFPDGAALSLCALPRNIETRWATPENPLGERGAGGREKAGRKGRANRPLPPGANLTLAESSGRSGTIRRIWMTLGPRDPVILRGLRIEIFWDGAATPAVSCPLGDFFGHALGRMQPFDAALFSSPEGRSFNCFVPMPFRDAFRIVVTNDSDRPGGPVFYEVNYTLGDDVGAAGYFHAHWRREAPTTPARDYEILPRVAGRGRFLGANVGVIADTGLYRKTWWGEGEFKVYLDGDEAYPTLVGTGTEDHIGTAWCLGRYANLYQGCPLADEENFQYAFYRHHIPDPVYFQSEIRAVMQQIGCSHRDNVRELIESGTLIDFCYRELGGRLEDHAEYPLFERADDWSSCGYFYLDRPENGLPALAPVADRIAGLLEVAASEQKPA
ncbi:MAG TPA: glycoside hydrolase family 172 protein [Candidatus Methylacidiphilales bacterium]